MPDDNGDLRDDEIALDGGPRLALRRARGSGRPFLLVHGLASNARMWDGVARRLVGAGHEVAAVDLRGHGRSEQTADGYSTQTAADDLAAAVAALGWTGALAPVVAGQSWGGNVVLSLAAHHGGVAAVALVDGGWIRLRDRFPTFEDCWRALAPPSFAGVRRADLESRVRAWTAGWPADGVAGMLANFLELPDGTVRARLAHEHHRDIVRSLWEGDPRSLYPRVTVPALLMAAVPVDGDEPAGAAAELARDKRSAVEEAVRLLPNGEVRWYAGAHHDLHAQQPERAAADLLELAARVPAAAVARTTGA